MSNNIKMIPHMHYITFMLTLYLKWETEIHRGQLTDAR